MLPTLLASLLLTAAPDIAFDHILALPPARGGSRTPFRADPVIAATMTGLWHTPAAGDKIGDREWKSLAPDKDGLYEDRALAGGYALATFDSQDDTILILEASGHTMVYVNPTQTAPGELHTGDPYENGSVRVPIHAHKGANTLLFATGRGHLRLKLTTPPAPVFISAADATMPDLVEEVATTTLKPLDLLGAVVVVNASDQWQRGLTILSFCPGESAPVRSPVPPIPPLSIRKIPVNLVAHQQLTAGEAQFDLAIVSQAENPTKVPFKIRIRKPDQTRKITFRSDIDGSIQYFGFNPAALPDPSDKKPARPGLILSLHGASVEAAHQAECYTLKPWAALAAPTNRREYGFDWEDWGRLDALEVLALAKSIANPDPARIYLTGHSMGGHGTWLTGVTFPDMFAAIAPSAGWTTFWSYGGAQHFDHDPTPIQKLFQRAMNPGDTIALARNLISPPTGVYILHGDKDDNVPVEQARTMKSLLEHMPHPDLQYHEQPGAGHWWGNECMDWPPLMDFLKSHSIPKDSQVTHLQFTTANPTVSSLCHWAGILQQESQGDLSSIDLTLKTDEHNFQHHIIEGTTTNVATLAIRTSAFGPDTRFAFVLDDAIIEPVASPKDGMIYLKHIVPPPDPDTGIRSKLPTWQVTPPPPTTEKNPQRSGPFKHAFNHHTLLLYGTQGTPAENAWMLSKARFDAESIYYRGNGAFDIVSDADFTPAAYPDRSIIIYGNSQINAAWPSLLADSPLTVHEGGCFIGEHEFKKDSYATLFVRPRTGDGATPHCLIGAVGITDINGARAVERLNYFSSGIAYPDWTIFSSYTLTKGMDAVEAAGFFGNDWNLDESQSAYTNP